jgi:hypothetical protein
MKGYRGEKEVLTLLEEIVKEEYNRAGMGAPELARSPNGRDIRGISWIGIEVKYRESMQMDQWWTQCKVNTPAGAEPVLIWRANYQPWRVRMFGFLDSKSARVRTPVDIGVEPFLIWFRERLKHELKR